MSFVVWVFCFCCMFKDLFDLFHLLCVLFLYGGVISEMMFMCVDSIASYVLSQASVSETCLSLYFKLLLLVVSIFVFGVVGILILVVFWLLSVSVVHSYSCVTGIFSGIFRFALPNKSSFTRGGVCGRGLFFGSFGSASSSCSPWR